MSPFTLKTIGINLRHLLFVQECFCNPHFQVLATIRENLFENVYIGTCDGTFPDSIVSLFTLKTAQIYSLTFVICAKVFFQPSLSNICHYKGNFVCKCIWTSYGTFSDSFTCPFTLRTTEIYSLTFIICAKVFLQPSPSSTCHYKRKIYLRMYRDLLWYLF